MITYLKNREYYEDLYDKLTVEHCRHMAAFDTSQGLTDADFEVPNITDAQVRELGTKVVKAKWADVVVEISVFMYAAERYNNKAQSIDAWMRDDKAKDDFCTDANPPLGAECRECLSGDLRVISKDLYWEDGEAKRVLFMFKCSKCGTNSAYFDNGEKWKVEATLCPVCQSERNTHSKTEKKHLLTITYTCQRCDNVWKETLDFRPAKREKPDPNYHEDRKFYCYSEKVRKYADGLARAGPIYQAHFGRDEEREKREKLKKQLESIQKLTVVQVSARLEKLLKKNGYTDFQLGAPDTDRELVVPFTLIDRKADRSADRSRSTVWKLVNQELKATNWRLVRSSLGYRLGYIKGKLRGYEHEFELQKLIEKSKLV